jgi:choline dehydrogenase-like flavoprotein
MCTRSSCNGLARVRRRREVKGAVSARHATFPFVLLDAADVRPGATVDADVCIVGGGPAAITVARELAGSTRSVVLLESGGFSREPDTEALRDASISGVPHDFNHARPRLFGGASTHWSGWCRPLDRWAFEPRPWLTSRGWPLAPETLGPFYERAARLFDLETPHEPSGWTWDWAYWARRFARIPGTSNPLDNDVVTGAVFRLSATDFGTTYRPALTRARNVTVCTHATVVGFLTDEQARTVVGARVRTLGGNEFVARGTAFVLATGGIDNARLLLASRDVAPNGLGNDHDLVGRYFMDHPEGTVGTVTLHEPARQYTELLENAVPVLTLTPKVMHDEQLLGACVLLEPYQRDVPDGADRGTGITPDDAARLSRRVDRRPHATLDAYSVAVRAEPRPTAESRVTLSGEVDALGLPRPHVHYVISRDTFESIERTIEIIGRELGRYGSGRMRLDVEGLGDGSFEPLPAWHLMGTTRMDADPRYGVVDGSGRVHGIDNLYVAGSSVFPSVGFSNPTYTIVALALRLADHLKRALR